MEMWHIFSGYPLIHQQHPAELSSLRDPQNWTVHFLETSWVGGNSCESNGQMKLLSEGCCLTDNFSSRSPGGILKRRVQTLLTPNPPRPGRQMCLYTLTLSSLWQLQGQWWCAQRWVDGLVWIWCAHLYFWISWWHCWCMIYIVKLPSFGIDICWFIFYCFCSIVSFRKRPGSVFFRKWSALKKLLAKINPADRCCSFFWASSSSPFGELQRLQNPSGDPEDDQPAGCDCPIKLLQNVVDHDSPHNNP